VVAVASDLVLTKDDGATSIDAGGTTTYTITLTNSGPADAADGVVVTDILPAGTTGSELEADCNVSVGIFVCTTNAPLLAGDSISWALTLQVDSGYVLGSLDNEAVITTSTVADTDTSNDSAIT
jgi:uncharacterized repeat protein (TIGR01451 family)